MTKRTLINNLCRLKFFFNQPCSGLYNDEYFSNENLDDHISVNDFFQWIEDVIDFSVYTSNSLNIKEWPLFIENNNDFIEILNSVDLVYKDTSLLKPQSRTGYFGEKDVSWPKITVKYNDILFKVIHMNDCYDFQTKRLIGQE